MTRTDHLLTTFSEELGEVTLAILATKCGEAAQRTSKALRFGLSEVQPGQFFTNAERIAHEMADVLGVYSMLVREGILPEVEEARVRRKVKKVEEYLGLSDQQGRLTP